MNPGQSAGQKDPAGTPAALSSGLPFRHRAGTPGHLQDLSITSSSVLSSLESSSRSTWHSTPRIPGCWGPAGTAVAECRSAAHSWGSNLPRSFPAEPLFPLSGRNMKCWPQDAVTGHSLLWAWCASQALPALSGICQRTASQSSCLPSQANPDQEPGPTAAGSSQRNNPAHLSHPVFPFELFFFPAMPPGMALLLPSAAARRRPLRAGGPGTTPGSLGSQPATCRTASWALEPGLLLLPAPLVQPEHGEGKGAFRGSAGNPTVTELQSAKEQVSSREPSCGHPPGEATPSCLNRGPLGRDGQRD